MRRGRHKWENIFHKLDMKVFLEDKVKIEKGTLSEGVVEKDTRTGFEIKFVGRIATQTRKV